MPNAPDTGGQPSKRTRRPQKGTRQATRAAFAGRRVEQAAIKERRDSLLSAICHDLRAPLAAVTMGAHFVLQTTKRDDASARSVRILEAMLRSCSQMERLIRNFADLSEIEAGPIALRMGLHDAGELLELAAEGVRESANTRAVGIEVREPVQAIALRCDRERLLRALGHLVDNAVKHAPTGSTVTLSVSLMASTVSFAVADSGPGLAPEVRANLFDRHWHAKRTNRDGAGFGLAIARGFVMAHQGEIIAPPPSAGETVFTLSLPKDGPPSSPH